MLVRLIGVAAAALLGGAAHAQSNGPVSPSQATAQTATGSWTGPLGDSSPSATARSPAVSSSMSSSSAVNATAMESSADVAASAASAGADVSTTMPMAGSTVTVSTVTNGPVPDTAENRAKYGQPLSRAGKMTRPAGN